MSREYYRRGGCQSTWGKINKETIKGEGVERGKQERPWEKKTGETRAYVTLEEIGYGSPTTAVKKGGHRAAVLFVGLGLEGKQRWGKSDTGNRSLLLERAGGEMSGFETKTQRRFVAV